MRVRLRDAAADELEAIGEYIARDNPAAAARLIAAIRRAIGRIAETGFVEMARAGRRPGTRELVVGRYILTYRYDERRNELVVISIVHGARRR